MKLFRYGAWAAVAVLLLVVGYTTVGYYQQVAEGGGSMTPIAAVGGPFTMTDASTETEVTEEDFKGRPSAFFFGFTYCPDVCPTTLAETQGWIDELGVDADKVDFAFITVDPERDTPDVMRDYVGAFDDRIRPLTGTRAQVDAMISAYRVYAKRIELDDGDYTMDHTASVYLMDADNRFVGTIAWGEAHETAVAKLRRLIDQAS